MEEWFDLVTADGRQTGLRKRRDDVHRDGDWHVAAHVWIVTPDLRVLLQRRALAKENHPGLWDVSVAGHVAAGESAVEAAVRECLEEIGLVVNGDELVPIGSMRSEQSLNGGSYVDREHHRIFLLRHDVDIGSLTLDLGEVAAVMLVPLDALEERVRRGDPTLVDHGDEYARLIEVLRGV